MLGQRQLVCEASLATAGRRNNYGNSSGKPTIVWNDRSLFGDAIFASVNYARGNMTVEEWKVYLSILKSKSPYKYDHILFFDVDAERAHFLNQEHRKDPAEARIPLEYFEHLRLAYYLQLREQALSGQARIVYFFNLPFVNPRFVLECLVKAPSLPKVKKIFETAPILDGQASPKQVSDAFAIIRKAYEDHYK
jgi:hypothetical protein